VEQKIKNMIDINKIRGDFPILSKEGIYFDNACQSLRPQSVIDAVTSYYTNYSACAGRSGHHLAEMVTKKYEESRQILANFLNAKRKEETRRTEVESQEVCVVRKQGISTSP